MRRIWKVKPADEKRVGALAKELGVHSLLARILIHRGADSPQRAEEFLCADLSSLAPPQRMADLPKALSLIRQAIARKEKVLLVGDYDVDGLTGTALLFRVLKSLGAHVSCHIPHRLREGYGLKIPVIEEAVSAGVKVLISVDCGTNSFKELALAKKLKLTSIVVDHHDISPEGLPPAGALLNPLRADCSYPTKDLASVGVAFTLARGLLHAVPGTGAVPGTVFDHLDLVALGTVADVAPLVGENRILVRAGLHRLRGSQKPGIRTLLSRLRLTGEDLTTEEVSFLLAPRLNAMGRVSSAGQTLTLLTTEDPEEAQALTKEMLRENRLRMTLTREALTRALAKVEREVNFSTDRMIILQDDEWHPGVVGIVAARLTHRFHRPAVVVAFRGEVGRGSARSVSSFHLVEALEKVKEHLVEFGGHPAAAGLTLLREQFQPFQKALHRVAQERLDPKALTPYLEADAKLPLSALTEDLMRDLKVLAPFGAGNPHPVFLSEELHIPVQTRPIGYGPAGIRFLMKDSLGRLFTAIHSRQEMEGFSLRQMGGRRVHVAYSPVYQAQQQGSRMTLTLRDLKLSAPDGARED